MQNEIEKKSLPASILANEGFFNAEALQDPDLPVRVVSVRFLSGMPLIQVTGPRRFRIDN